MANEYADLAELKNALELNSENFADPDLQRALTAASRAIDGVTKRRFYQDTDANQVRYYSPRSPGRVAIDDLAELTEVATGTGDNQFGTVLTENTDFVLGPLNADADDRPWTRIETVTASLPCGRRTVRVTGRFGWQAVPDDVKQATLIIATKLVRRTRDAPFGIAGLGIDGAAVRISRSDPDVLMLLGQFTRRLVG